MHSSRESSIHLPVVDISQFPQDLDADNVQNHPLVATVREACKEWGFFCLINHGISVDLIQKVESVSRELLSMPTEIKKEGRKEGHSYLELLSSDSILEISEKIWPGGNSNMCETIESYNSCLSDLSQKIIVIILVSLGLDPNKFYESVFGDCNANLRINHYASLGQAVGDEALGPHTDPNTFTILYQDEAGGLEIRSKEGNWMSVKPVSHSFVINIGDSLKAWSNGRYRSAEHHVVRKGWTDRISIGSFVRFSEEMEIWAPPELVDAENPRRYKPFTYSQFLCEVIKNAEQKKGNLATLIDRFAGL